MRRSFLIARSNIRVAKGQTVAIIVLILLADLMLNLWLMLSMDYKANFDRYHDKLNAEHVTITVDGDSKEFQEFLSQTFEGDSRTSEYTLDACVFYKGAFQYNGGEMGGLFVFLDKQTALERSVGRSEIVEEGSYTSGVYLPMIYKTEDIDIGKPIEISIGSHKEIYTICGFFNNVMMGSQNCVITQIILTEDKYAELAESEYAPRATLCSVRLTDKADNQNYEADLKSQISACQPNISMVSNCYDSVAQARYISQMICSGIMSAMAFLILLIALVVIASNIINYIQVNMKNLGALKAVGYTSRQLILSLLLQFTGLTFIVSIVGTRVSYCLFPLVNDMMIVQTGIPYEVQFLPLPFIISLAVLLLAVSIAVWFASRKIRKIEPIVALRFGIQTHSFKKNHVMLEKTRLPVNIALALKNAYLGIKNNITICFTMFVLSLVIAFSGLMTENVIVDMTPFLTLLIGESADSCINVQAEVEEDFLHEIEKDSRVEKIYLYHSLNVSHVDGPDLLAILCDDFSKINNQSVAFEGRFPKYDNEIAIAVKYAKEKGLKIGDEIEITANGKQVKYLICGFTQISNNLGKDCLLTRAGYERLGTLDNTSYYLNLADEVDVDAFNSEMKEKFNGSVNEVINFLSTIEGSAGVYVSLMTIIVIAILILSAVIIVFVLYLIVSIMLNNKQRDHGILKSLGFTTRHLILQTALSFMPTIIVSTIVGLSISSLIINPLTALFLSGIGIVKCTFAVPLGFTIGAGIGLVLFAFLILCLLSKRIRKITPKALLSGE